MTQRINAITGDALVEKVARAICVAMKLDPDRQYPVAKEWEAMRETALAAIETCHAEGTREFLEEVADDGLLRVSPGIKRKATDLLAKLDGKP